MLLASFSDNLNQQDSIVIWCKYPPWTILKLFFLNQWRIECKISNNMLVWVSQLILQNVKSMNLMLPVSNIYCSFRIKKNAIISIIKRSRVHVRFDLILRIVVVENIDNEKYSFVNVLMIFSVEFSFQSFDEKIILSFYQR